MPAQVCTLLNSRHYLAPRTIRMLLVISVACSLCLRSVKGLVRFLRDFNMHKQLLVSDCKCSLTARAHS